MPAPNERSASAVLFDLATALALVTALVYATGWTYAYHYFGHFKLGLLMLEIPYPYFFMYGFWVFKEWWWLLVLLYGLVAVPYFIFVPALLPRLRQIESVRPWLLKHLQVPVVLLTFLLAWWMAAASADRYYREQQRQGFTDYPHVRVWTKKPLPENAKLRKIYEALPEGNHRLLLQNRDKLFLFKLPRDGKPARVAVIQLALSDVRALRVLP
jgi:hypothetical protein